MKTKTFLIIGGLIILIIITAFSIQIYNNTEPETDPAPTAPNIETPPETEIPPTPPKEVLDRTQTVLGRSANGHEITAYHYGVGDREILFVGGIHGGYAWNTNLVAYELMDYLTGNPSLIPSSLKVTVVPTLNPDGLRAVTGTTGRFNREVVPTDSAATVIGRFNGNGVDLNRNFDCEWKSEGKWKERAVSGGESPFSESETKALRDYVLANNPTAAVIWYSSAGGVFMSSCGGGVSPVAKQLAERYAIAADYPVYQDFDFYEVTGDLANWLAKERVPTISVLLSSAGVIEWNKNRAGVQAIFDYYSQ